MLTEKEARRITDDIKKDLGLLWDKIIKAWDGEAHKALGYDSWQAYVSGEFDSDYLSVPRNERQRVVAMLREHQMSTRAIAATVNADRNTVKKDLQVGEIHPPKIKGTDGRTYQASHSRSRQTVPPEPIQPTVTDTEPSSEKPEPLLCDGRRESAEPTIKTMEQHVKVLLAYQLTPRERARVTNILRKALKELEAEQ